MVQDTVDPPRSAPIQKRDTETTALLVAFGLKAEAIENLRESVRSTTPPDPTALALVEGLRTNQVVKVTMAIENEAAMLRETYAANMIDGAQTPEIRVQRVETLTALLSLLGDLTGVPVRIEPYEDISHGR